MLLGAGAVVVALSIGALMMVLRPEPETVLLTATDRTVPLAQEPLDFPQEAPSFGPEGSPEVPRTQRPPTDAAPPPVREVPKKESGETAREPVAVSTPVSEQEVAAQVPSAEDVFQPPPDSAFVATFSATSGVEFRVRPKKAIVEVDGEAIGVVDDFDSEAKAYHFNGPGTYSVRLSARDYVPMWLRVVIVEGAPESVTRVRLRMQKGDDSQD